MKKRTLWFNGNPVTRGAWEVKGMFSPRRIFFSYWDGHKWGLTATSPKRAYEFRSYDNSYQTREWRGLAVNPKDKP